MRKTLSILSFIAASWVMVSAVEEDKYLLVAVLIGYMFLWLYANSRREVKQIHAKVIERNEDNSAAKSA